jgi:hypothetical protein
LVFKHEGEDEKFSRSKKVHSPDRYNIGGVVEISLQVGDCWLWSLIIFLIQRSLFSAMFIPHEDFTPQKNVHSSTRGSVRGVTPLAGYGGVIPLMEGLWESRTWMGVQGRVFHDGGSGEAPEGKIAL